MELLNRSRTVAGVDTTLVSTSGHVGALLLDHTFKV